MDFSIRKMIDKRKKVSLISILFLAFGSILHAQPSYPSRIPFEDTGEEYMFQMNAIKDQYRKNQNDINRILFSQFAGNLLQTMAEKRRSQELSTETFTRHVFGDLYRNKERDVESKYLLSYLIRVSPKLLSYTYNDYSLDQARIDLEFLAFQKSHPGALFEIASNQLDGNGDKSQARKLISDAGKLGSFEAQAKEYQFFLKESIPGFDHNDFQRKLAVTAVNKNEKNKLIYEILTTYATKWDYESILKLRNSNIEIDGYLRNLSKNGKSNKKSSGDQHPLIMEISKSITGNSLEKDISISISKEFISILEGSLENKSLSDSDRGSVSSILGDYYLGEVFVKPENFFLNNELDIELFRIQSFFVRNNYFKDLEKAYRYYKTGSELGNQKSLFTSSFMEFYGIGTLKDQQNAMIGFHQLDKLNYHNKVLIDHLGIAYFYGIGTEKDFSKSRKYLESSVADFGSKTAFEHLFFSSGNLKTEPYPYLRRIDKTQLLSRIKESDCPIVLLHFFHQGFLPDEYSKTYLLQKEFKNSENIKLIFASNTDGSDLVQISKSMGYRGIIYTLPLEKEPEYTDLYKSYYKRLFNTSEFFGMEDQLMKNVGNIMPEFDERWSQLGLPATFLFVKDEPQPYYFDASAPTDEIIFYVNQLRKIQTKH